MLAQLERPADPHPCHGPLVPVSLPAARAHVELPLRNPDELHASHGRFDSFPCRFNPTPDRFDGRLDPPPFGFGSRLDCGLRSFGGVQQLQGFAVMRAVLSGRREVARRNLDRLVVLFHVLWHLGVPEEELPGSSRPCCSLGSRIRSMAAFAAPKSRFAICFSACSR